MKVSDALFGITLWSSSKSESISLSSPIQGPIWTLAPVTTMMTNSAKSCHQWLSHQETTKYKWNLSQLISQSRTGCWQTLTWNQRAKEKYSLLSLVLKITSRAKQSGLRAERQQVNYLQNPHFGILSIHEYPSAQLWTSILKQNNYAFTVWEAVSLCKVSKLSHSPPEWGDTQSWQSLC